MSLLKRAKEQGLKITPEGQIKLPGTLKNKPKKEKKSRKPRLKEKPEFLGFNSKIFSRNPETLGKIIEGLKIFQRALVTLPPEKQDYKLSTYKKEIRFAMKVLKASELFINFTQEDLKKLEEIGWGKPDNKEFFSLEITD